jgi:alpha-L-fucosidase
MVDRCPFRNVYPLGIIALPARHEWVKNVEKMTNEQYQKYFDVFNPDMFDPHQWAKMAKAAGMKYVVLTSKHHEGFCLFDSKFTDYKATNTPYGKDLIKEYVEAFRAEGLKVGFYYSLITQLTGFTRRDRNPTVLMHVSTREGI